MSLTRSRDVKRRDLRSPAAVGTGTRDLLRRILRRRGPGVFVGFGCLLFVAGNGYFLQYNSYEAFLTPLGAINVGFYAVLGGTIVLCGALLGRGDISRDRYPRAVAWILCGVAFLLFLNGPVMGLLAGVMSSAFLIGWILNVVGTGSVAGAVVGVVEARSIERAHDNQRLVTARESAESHAEQLDYLNSVLRHEVLNNVGIIKGYAELVLEGGRSDHTAELETIHRQSREMAKVITDVRVLLESIQDTYSLAERDLSETLADELANVQAKTEGEIQVEATIPEDVVVVADDLLPRVFGNLFSNAVEHNDDPNPRLSVTVTEWVDEVTVRVADDGPGIPAAEREALFERSRRADHGLGLYIVGTLVERYGGSIELAETGPDGTAFDVTLQRAPGSAVSDEACQVTTVSS